MYIYLSDSPSFSPSLYLSLSIFLFFSPSLSLSVTRSLFPSLSLFYYVSTSLCASHSLSLYPPLFLSHSLSHVCVRPTALRFLALPDPNWARTERHIQQELWSKGATKKIYCELTFVQTETELLYETILSKLNTREARNLSLDREILELCLALFARFLHEALYRKGLPTPESSGSVGPPTAPMISAQ